MTGKIFNRFNIPTHKSRKLDPNTSQEAERTRKQLNTRSQQELLQALQGIEGSLEPFMQAGTLFSASPFPATASGITPAG